MSNNNTENEQEIINYNEKSNASNYYYLKMKMKMLIKMHVLKMIKLRGQKIDQIIRVENYFDRLSKEIIFALHCVSHA